MPAPGMSVPGASDLGLDMSSQQTGVETDEERRKRLLGLQQQRLLPSLSAGASSLGLDLTGYGAAGRAGALGGR